MNHLMHNIENTLQRLVVLNLPPFADDGKWRFLRRFRCREHDHYIAGVLGQYPIFNDITAYRRNADSRDRWRQHIQLVLRVDLVHMDIRPARLALELSRKMIESRYHAAANGCQDRKLWENSVCCLLWNLVKQ